MRSLNLCFLCNKYPPEPGGLAIAVRRLAQGMAAAGHRVQLCVPDGGLPPGRVEPCLDDAIQLYRFGPHPRPEDTQATWFELVEQRHQAAALDVLHGYYIAGAGFVTVYAGRYLGVPAVISARGNDLDRAVFRPGQTGPVVWALRHAAAVTTVSQALARKAQALVPGCPVTVVGNGVDGAFFTPPATSPAGDDLRQQLDLPPDIPLLGFVGEARLKKGLGVLLPALAQVVAAQRALARPGPALLLIGGVRSADKDLVRVFKAQHPDLKVRVLPYVTAAELVPLYQALDILLFPSLRDGLPNALLEGMACARPVVASGVGGIPDVVQDGENGLLVPAGDVVALAVAINALLADPAGRAQLGAAARQTVLARFTLAGELAANLVVYRAIVPEA